MKHANLAIFIPHSGCPHQCSFCNQHTITGVLRQPDRKTVRETVTKMLSCGACSEHAEIAFFGGSFTALDRAYMEELLSAAYPYVRDGLFRGIRVSTRPDAIDRERLSLCQKYGVTAIELGVQSMDDAVLAKNRRGHTARQVVSSAALIREMGFSLGVQMMVGLYGDTKPQALLTAEKLIALQPDTARIYPTLVMKGTDLQEWFYAGRYRPMPLGEAVALCAALLLRFEKAGVTVIRVGLHDMPELRENLVAGPYHPAFRELCESRIMKANLFWQMKGCLQGEVSLRVNPRDLSKAVGHQGENKTYFQSMGYMIKLVEDAAVPQGTCLMTQPIEKVGE